jgi:tRNA-intron endonuclease, archaea type
LPTEEIASSTELERSIRPETQKEIDQVIPAIISKKGKRVVLLRKEDELLLESKGFGIRDGSSFFLLDYEVLYLMFTKKLRLSMDSKTVSFEKYVALASKRDKDAWARFLIFRDLRSRGYVVREGFGFPIDFRIYDRGDFGAKAAKYIVFGLNEGKTMSMADLKENIDQMAKMGKEAVVAVVERRGEVIYYKVGKWRPGRPQAS